MWLFTKFGFYSVVKKQRQIMIRARVRRDLENLMEATGLRSPIVTSTTTDYPHRILVSPAQWKTAASVICDSITYPNFKSEVGLIPDQRGRSSAYHRIWAIMREVQRGEGGTQSGRYGRKSDQLHLYDDDDHP